MPVSAPRCLASAAMMRIVSAAAFEQDVIDDRFVLQRYGADRCGHGEHDVEVGDRQQFGLSIGKPLGTGQTLALGAVPVTAGIVGHPQLAAVAALFDMTAERRRAAGLNSGHDPTLPVGQGGGTVGTIVSAVAAEYIRHLERRPHEHAGSA